MNRIKMQAWLLACVMLFAVSDVAACLTFCLQQGRNYLYGRNFDWNVDVGAVIINQRNVRKRAFVLPPGKPMTWVSQFGNITFNQFSKEVPIGGMNEKGLVIESLVSTAQHPRPDTRDTINELQWIQYHLDTCKTVDEVMRSARAVRISKYAVNLHYFVSDHSGESAVIEFLNGKMVHRSADSLPIKVLANRRYDHALKTVQSLSRRFGKAAQMIENYDGKKNPRQYAFRILDKVAQGDHTKWQIVYDIPARQIHFRTLRNRKTKLISLSDFDFSGTEKALILDVNFAGEGNVGKHFQTYTAERNDKLINTCMQAFKKANMMQHIRPRHIEYIKKAVNSSRQEPKKNSNVLDGAE